jgi:hypothetical protein
VAVLALFVAVSCDQSLPTAAPDEAEVTAPGFKVVQNDKVPFAWSEFNTCTGEWMDVEGRMHFVVRETFDSAGGVHQKFQMQSMGMKAVGRTTGMICQANGPTHDNWNFKPDAGPLEYWPQTYSSSQRYLWICPGPRNDAKGYHHFHVTVNANREATAWVENDRVECLPD